MNAPGHRYRDFVSSFAPTLPLMPVMHSCFGLQFTQILDSREIQARGFDPVINDDVSFHFYGKPSYRPRNDGTYNNNLRSALYSFILDYRKLPPPRSILPFDSGGYDAIYKNACGDAPVEDFYLPKGQELPARFVAAFFGTNQGYFSMKVRAGVEKDIKALDFHSEGLIHIFKSQHSANFDQRAGSIELHYSGVIKLSSDNLLGVVAPDTACDDPELQEFAGELEADLIRYELDLENSDSRQRQVREAVRPWLEEKGFYGA